MVKKSELARVVSRFISSASAARRDPTNYPSGLAGQFETFLYDLSELEDDSGVDTAFPKTDNFLEDISAYNLRVLSKIR